MYSKQFCKVYNEFGWNYFPEAFGGQLIEWMKQHDFVPKTSLDLGCGTGILARCLFDHGIAARGMDFSQAMIDIARRDNPMIPFETADMITYRPDERFDLVTCTGDALNHILREEDLAAVFQNVYAYLNPGGYFIFDILNENEVSTEEPFELDWSETVKAIFTITQNSEQKIHLKTSVYENGELQFEEVITETIHDLSMIRSLIEQAGLTICRVSDHLLEDSPLHGTTWFFIVQKA